ncbi:hypothetical protein Droror1_Dr00027668 [Drosera rotundifolia]
MSPKILIVKHRATLTALMYNAWISLPNSNHPLHFATNRCSVTAQKTTHSSSFPNSRLIFTCDQCCFSVFPSLSSSIKEPNFGFRLQASELLTPPDQSFEPTAMKPHFKKFANSRLRSTKLSNYPSKRLK